MSKNTIQFNNRVIKDTNTKNIDANSAITT